MTTTRSQNAKAFKHIMENIFPTQMPNLSLAMDYACVTSTHELMTLSDKDIEDLYYEPPASKSSPTKTTQDPMQHTPLKKLEIAFRNQIRCFQGFYHMRCVKDKLTTVSNADILSWTGDEFDEFRISAPVDVLTTYIPETSPGSSAPSTLSTATTSSSTSNSLSEIKKGTKYSKDDYKCSKDDYITLQDPRQWDSWHHSTLATAHEHGCDKVFTPKYAPSAAEKDVFKKKQKFLYSVFGQKLPIDYSKCLIYLHEKDFDAQAVFKVLSLDVKAIALGFQPSKPPPKPPNSSLPLCQIKLHDISQALASSTASTLTINHSPFAEFGNYWYHADDLHTFDIGEQLHTGIDDPDILHDDDDNPITLQNIVDDTIMAHDSHQSIFVQEHQTLCNLSLHNPKPPDHEALGPFFLDASASVVKHTFNATTQFAYTNLGSLMKKQFKSPFSAYNILRHNEPVATDTVYSNVPAIAAAQLFVGRKILVIEAYGMTFDTQFLHTLEDKIRKWGAMDKQISDNAQVEVGNCVKDILCAEMIDDWQSKLHYQHQNFAEYCYSTIKPMLNKLLDRTGAPAYCWLLPLSSVIFVLNHTAPQSLNMRTPIESLTGSTPGINSLVLFHFWESVYYKVNDSSFPSESTEKLGRFVGIAEHVGGKLTFKILIDDTFGLWEGDGDVSTNQANGE